MFLSLDGCKFRHNKGISGDIYYTFYCDCGNSSVSKRLDDITDIEFEEIEFDDFTLMTVLIKVK